MSKDRVLTPAELALADWWRNRRPVIPMSHLIMPGVKIVNVNTFVLHISTRVDVALELPYTSGDLWGLLDSLRKQLGDANDGDEAI